MAGKSITWRIGPACAVVYENRVIIGLFRCQAGVFIHLLEADVNGSSVGAGFGVGCGGASDHGGGGGHGDV